MLKQIEQHLAGSSERWEGIGDSEEDLSGDIDAHFVVVKTEEVGAGHQ
jgi:hypothetical protein